MKSIKIDKTGLIDYISRYGTIAGLIVLVIFFSIVSDRFLTVRNIFNVLRQISFLAIVASGLTVCMAAGDFDLSIGRTAGLAGIITTTLLVQGSGIVIALAAGLLTGILVGFINGILIAIIGIPSLIATLAIQSVALGFNYMITEGRAIYGGMPQSFFFMGQGNVGPIPTPVIIMAIFWLIIYILLNKTTFGRYMYAIGGNFTAATLSGINTVQKRIIGLMISGGSAAFAGILLASRLGSGQPGAGEGFLLDGLGSVFIGMTVFNPGQANIKGSLLGALIFGVLGNGLNLLGTPYYIQDITQGVVMVAAVAMAVYNRDKPLF